MSIFDIFKKTKQAKKLKEVVQTLEKNEIVIEPQDGEVTSPDASKIGGKPYLPIDFEWPTFYNKEDGVTRPLSFFCQINLSEVKKLDEEGVLPEVGMLYFFYECESLRWGFEPDDKDAAKVIYFENTSGFQPFELPKELSKEYVIPEIAIQFIKRKSYPQFEEFVVHNDTMCDFEEYDKILEKLGINVDVDEEIHKLLGYANIIQDEMLTECESASRRLGTGNSQNPSKAEEKDIQKHASEWILLLQLSIITTNDFEWMFGDCGMLYFYIRKDDLAKRNFEKVHFSVQCG